MGIDISDLQSKIRELIYKKKEGEYWDFKQTYPENVDLLHDVLCMANCLFKGNRYIIIGVKDNFEIIGIDEPKKQADVNDFFSNIHFAGDIRPEIELNNLKIDNKQVDVITICDKPNKPYFLSKDFSEGKRVIRAGVVYSRVGDKNTAINCTVDLYHLEKMWEQHFGLDEPIADRLRKLLKKPQEWSNLVDTQEISSYNKLYHKYSPEFTIELSEPEEREGESFCYYFFNKTSFWETAYFKYNSVTIFNLDYVYCDEMRILLPVPEIMNLNPGSYGYWFYYYILNNDRGLFLQFIHNDVKIESRGECPPILIFESDDEFRDFVQKAKKEIKNIEKLKPKTICFRKQNFSNESCRITENARFLSQIYQFYNLIWLPGTDSNRRPSD
jgi:hypothetical protein